MKNHSAGYALTVDSLASILDQLKAEGHGKSKINLYSSDDYEHPTDATNDGFMYTINDVHITRTVHYVNLSNNKDTESTVYFTINT